jgi:hypothetical protein
MVVFLENTFPFLLSIGFFGIIWITARIVTSVKKEAGPSLNYDSNDHISRQFHQHFMNSQSGYDWQQQQFFQNQQSNSDSNDHQTDQHNYYYENNNSFDSGSGSANSGSSSSSD